MSSYMVLIAAFVLGLLLFLVEQLTPINYLDYWPRVIIGIIGFFFMLVMHVYSIKKRKKASFFKTYEWFAVYPVMQKKETEEGSTVTFGDLRFYTNLKILRQTFNRDDMEFSLTAVLNKQQEITGFVYQRPGRTKTIQYLE